MPSIIHKSTIRLKAPKNLTNDPDDLISNFTQLAHELETKFHSAVHKNERSSCTRGPLSKFYALTASYEQNKPGHRVDRTFTQSTGYITQCSMTPASAPAARCTVTFSVGRLSYSESSMVKGSVIDSSFETALMPLNPVKIYVFRSTTKYC